MDKMPFDIKLEQEIIGSMLADPSCIAEVIDLIRPEHFYVRKYQKLCKEIYRLWNKSEDLVDLVELTPFLEKHPDLGREAISELTQLMGSIATTRIIRHHAQRLKDIASLRNLVQLGFEISNLGHLKDRDEIREAITKAEAKLSQVAETTVQTGTMKPIDDVLLRFDEELHSYLWKGGGVTGIPSGFDNLDKLTTGFQPGELTILAGRPSMGKTTFANDLAINMAIEGSKTVIYFTLEMSAESLMMRLISNVGMIDLQRLRSGTITKNEYERYPKALARMSQKKLFIDDQPALTIPEMKAKARRIKREHGLHCIIIDYLGMIGGKAQSRYDLISENTRQLKNMARELEVPVICLAQLSRAVEQRQDKRPMLSDLRESGEVEQTADLIMFLYRDDYYNKDTSKKSTELIIAKQRNGPLGTVEFLFVKEYSKFMLFPELKKEA